MSTKKILNFKKEELLCEKIRQFPVLFDKSHKGYKEKVAVENAWNEVPETKYETFLDFLFGEKYFGPKIFSCEVFFVFVFFSATTIIIIPLHLLINFLHPSS